MTAKNEYEIYLSCKLFNENFMLDKPVTLEESENSCEEYFKRVLLRLSNMLTPQEEKILLMRIGISTSEPCTSEYVAKKLDFSCEYILKYEEKINRRLRSPARANMLCAITTQEDFEKAVQMFCSKYGNGMQKVFQCFLSFFEQQGG